MSLSSYQITCLTEGIRVVTNYGVTVPTVCPNNNQHTIDPDQTTVYDTQTLTEVTVLNPNGYYQATTSYLPMDACTPGTVFTKDISFPMRIFLWSIAVYPPVNSEDDWFDVISAPNTAIGYITSGIEIGATQMYVSSTVCENAIPGLDIAIYDGTNRDDLGRITAGDEGTLLCQFETPTTHAFTTGSLVELNLKNIRHFEMCRTTEYEIRLGSPWKKYKEVPANTIMRIVYHNMDGNAKYISMLLEYYIMPPENCPMS